MEIALSVLAFVISVGTFIISNAISASADAISELASAIRTAKYKKNYDSAGKCKSGR